MTFQETPEMIGAIHFLEDIHKGIAHKLSLNKRDNLLAIYIISGRILTHCHSILLLLKNGFFAEAGILIRSIYESAHVAEFLYENLDDSRALETWFNDDVIKPKKARKAQSKLIERAGGKKDDEFNKLVDYLYSELSKYTHPTFSISKINMNHNNNLYDYECSNIKKDYPSLPFSFGEVIVQIINMFCHLSAIYEIDQKKYNELRDYVEKLQNN